MHQANVVTEYMKPRFEKGIAYVQVHVKVVLFEWMRELFHRIFRVDFKRAIWIFFPKIIGYTSIRCLNVLVIVTKAKRKSVVLQFIQLACNQLTVFVK